MALGIPHYPLKARTAYLCSSALLLHAEADACRRGDRGQQCHRPRLGSVAPELATLFTSQVLSAAADTDIATIDAEDVVAAQ